MLTHFSRWRVVAAAVVTALLGAFIALGPAASAATVSCQAVPGCGSWDVPIHSGLDLNFTGYSTAINTPIQVWSISSAGSASDFLVKTFAIGTAGSVSPTTAGFRALTGGTYVTFQAAPHGVAAGTCVSSLDSSQGTHTALRACTGTVTGGTITSTTLTYNPWQTYQVVPVGDGLDQLREMSSPTNFTSPPSGALLLCLNDRAFGSNGSPVINYGCQPLGFSNQLWEPNELAGSNPH